MVSHVMRHAVRFRPAVRTGVLGVCLAAIVAGLIPVGRVAEGGREADSPDAAEAYQNARRAPLDAALNPGSLYAAAVSRLERLPRFSSRLSRQLSDAQPRARLWASGSRVLALDGDLTPTALLDAWTPLGPGNIGGRTRVMRYHPTRTRRCSPPAYRAASGGATTMARPGGRPPTGSRTSRSMRWPSIRATRT